MSNFCIISEFNPLHKGHEYIIRQARELGAHSLTCVMSGNAVQRGELAVADKYLRAEAAVKCGADLVVELPYPWSSATADFFAAAAVNIASHFGDVLLFGSECGDIGLLSDCARYCESDAFKSKYDTLIHSGIGSGEAFGKCIAEAGYGALSSNDLLGVAYIRIIYRHSLKMTPMTVKRSGADYNQRDTVDGEYQSATAMRHALERGDTEVLRQYLPSCMYEILANELEAGRITDISEADGAILGYLRLCSEDALLGIADTEGGLANRILSAAKESITTSQMLDTMKTKRYTDAKLRRALLYSLTGVRSELLRELPEYTTLLAANEQGRALLSQIRKTREINIVTKTADAPRNTAQYMAEEKLFALYGLARKNKMTLSEFFKKNAYILTLTK